MSEHDSHDFPAALPPPATAKAEPAAAPRRAMGGFAWLLVLLMVAGAGYAYWRWQGNEQARQTSAQAQTASVRDDLDALRRGSEASRRELEALRARLDDAGRVNESLRAQVLGLSERARLSEDAIANLADKRLSGHDTLLLNEAELLLVLAQERYALFADPAPTLAAYRLADAALAQANDAAFASVRQSIGAETAALSALQTPVAATAQRQLAALRDTLAGLTLAARNEHAEEAGPRSRFARIFGQFIRIRRDDDPAGHFARNDPQFARALLDASLRDAQAALLVRDTTGWQQALSTAQAQLAHDFDPAAPEVEKARALLDALAQTSIAPPAPNVLGSALKELRNLRATRNLQADSPGPAQTQSQTQTQPPPAPAHADVQP